MMLKPKKPFYVIPEGKSGRNFMSTSIVSEALRTKGALSNLLRKWCSKAAQSVAKVTMLHCNRPIKLKILN